MAGLDPAIHVFAAVEKRRGCPAKAGHDGERVWLTKNYPAASRW